MPPSVRVTRPVVEERPKSCLQLIQLKSAFESVIIHSRNDDGNVDAETQGGGNMHGRGLLTLAAIAAISVSLSAQTSQRRAVMKGGGDPGRGKCTVEVVVDGAAEVEIRGDMGTLRNLSGRPPEWRRFECNGVMPTNPGGFRFAGVDGRGRQQLIQDPRDGRAAVVRIEDPDNGAEGYTFDLFWGGNGYPPQNGYPTQNGYPGGNGYPSGNAYPGQNRYPDEGERRYGRDENRRDEDLYHRERDESFRRENWRDRFFERVRDDIEHAQSISFPFGNDQYRLVKTKQELNELQAGMASGRYDERDLDDVIGALARVVQDNRLGFRDREILTDDLNRLREFRARRRY
jgi:hypothetical protein